jgi:hypothetical protein
MNIECNLEPFDWSFDNIEMKKECILKAIHEEMNYFH